MQLHTHYISKIRTTVSQPRYIWKCVSALNLYFQYQFLENVALCMLWHQKDKWPMIIWKYRTNSYPLNSWRGVCVSCVKTLNISNSWIFEPGGGLTPIWFVKLGLEDYGLMTPYGDRYRGQHWLRLWLVAWRHQAITWTNVDVPSVKSIGIHLSTILPEILQHSITKISFNLTYVGFVIDRSYSSASC